MFNNELLNVFSNSLVKYIPYVLVWNNYYSVFVTSCTVPSPVCNLNLYGRPRLNLSKNIVRVSFFKTTSFKCPTFSDLQRISRERFAERVSKRFELLKWTKRFPGAEFFHWSRLNVKAWYPNPPNIQNPKRNASTWGK